ncbi:MAG TPA: hypothetical protein VE057_17935 [Archangium sp.]|nr:hypothetical protein [Archangium sp.]
MALLEDAFNLYLSRIELDDTRVARASQRFNAVKGVISTGLSKHFPGINVRQIGSFQRRTKIRPREDSDSLDVDALVVFGDVTGWVQAGTPGALNAGDYLSLVLDALSRDLTYQAMRPETDSPTVVLTYHDGFCMELAAGYRDLSGKYPRAGGPACYVIANGHLNWKPADYDYDAEIISGANQHPSVAGALVPTIKLLKQYLRARGVPLSSFHIEILATLILPARLAEWAAKGLKWGYKHALAAFLSDAAVLLQSPVSLPGSYSPPVDSKLSPLDLANVRAWVAERAKVAWTLCEADNSPGMGGELASLDRWRTFIGDPFPSYFALST